MDNNNCRSVGDNKLYTGGFSIMARIKKYDENVNAQTEANKAWKAKNKEHAKYLNYRSMARSFIRNLATDDDIEELKQLMAERESGKQ